MTICLLWKCIIFQNSSEMAVLDNNILSNILKPEYMNFVTCSTLKPGNSTLMLKIQICPENIQFQFFGKEATVLLPGEHESYFCLFSTIT